MNRKGQHYEAMLALFMEATPYLATVLRNRGFSKEDIEDATQELWIKFAEGAATARWDGRSRIGNHVYYYLFSSDVRAKQKLRARMSSLDDAGWDHESVDCLEDRIFLEQIIESLDGETQDTRAVVILSALGMTYSEIAERCDMSTTKAFRIMRRWRTGFLRRNGSQYDHPEGP